MLSHFSDLSIVSKQVRFHVYVVDGVQGIPTCHPGAGVQGVKQGNLKPGAYGNRLALDLW